VTTFDGNIYLIGFMGAGKSSLARWLAENQAMTVVEMDDALAEEAGMPITRIFAERGENWFRDRESALLKTVAAKGGQVVSCGGGVVLRPENVARMHQRGVVVWLTAAAATVLERVKEDHSRPLLEGRKNTEAIQALLDARAPAYKAAADLILPTDGRDTAAVGEDLLARLHARAARP
jgi:shikimate kinase